MTEGHQEDTFRKCRFQALLVVLLTGGLLAVVGRIQMVKREEWEPRIRNQQMRVRLMPGRRGTLYDRNGVPLNISVPRYDLAINVEELRDPRDTRNRTLRQLSSLVAELGIRLGPMYYRTRPEEEDIRRHLANRANTPLVLWRNVDEAALAQWGEACREIRGLDVLMAWRRHYESPDLAPQLRGFTHHMDITAAAPSENQTGLENLPRHLFYNQVYKELAGVGGMEAACNDTLTGQVGEELLQVDVFSYLKKVHYRTRSLPGTDVTLTIDFELQHIAEQQFREKELTGALVVMDARTGEVAVLASEPSFRLDEPQKALANSQLNRALGGLYPPGSILKPLVALAALEADVVKPEDEINCPGYFPLGISGRLRCNHAEGHGKLALREALARSCNTYFCTLGARLGPEGFEHLADKVPLGCMLGTELQTQEQAGICFKPSWVKALRKQDKTWRYGDLANGAIGQGDWLVTPLQMAVVTCAITTGRLFRPKLVMSSETALLETLEWPAEGWQTVKDGMRDCVQAPYGTGWRMRIPGVEVMGKTGTAEVGGIARPHAWSVMAAPADNPQWIGVCVVEHGGGGGKVAAPILQTVMAKTLQRIEN